MVAVAHVQYSVCLLLSRFRHSKDAINAKDSMSHALIRSLLNLGETDRLLNILRDKVNN